MEKLTLNGSTATGMIAGKTGHHAGVRGELEGTAFCSDAEG